MSIKTNWTLPKLRNRLRVLISKLLIGLSFYYCGK